MHILKQKINFIYTDTDSIFLLAKDLNRLSAELDPVNLGHLKVQGFYKEGIFLAPKAYALKIDDSNSRFLFKLKGLPRDSIIKNDSELYNFMLQFLNTPASLEISFNTLFSKNIKNFTVNQIDFLFRFAYNYDKRNKVYDSNGI